MIDSSLLHKYAVPVPRYTSYPTALSFHELTGPRPTSDADAPVSLYFHLPFCRSLCWYCACTKVVTRKQQRSATYLGRLLDEVDGRALSSDRRVVQLHLGGGTPTFFRADELETLVVGMRSRLDFADDAELSVEIDPRVLDSDQIEALARAGFSRVSLGVQDHNPQVQRHRLPSDGQHLNIDIIYI